MKKVIFLIITLGFVITSCKVTKTNIVRYDKSQVLNTLVGNSQDTVVASLIIKIIDIQTEELIPWARIQLSSEHNKKEYKGNFNGYLLLPNMNEGTYDIEIDFPAYNNIKIKEIMISKEVDVFITVGLLQDSGLIHM